MSTIVFGILSLKTEIVEFDTFRSVGKGASLEDPL